MAKNMARVEDGVVVNIEWWSDATVETTALKNMGERPVEIGHTYENGKFYKDGVEVLTSLEEALKKNAEYEESLLELGVEL